MLDSRNLFCNAPAPSHVSSEPEFKEDDIFYSNTGGAAN